MRWKMKVGWFSGQEEGIGKGLKTGKKRGGLKVQLMTYDLEKRRKLEFCQEIRMVKYTTTSQWEKGNVKRERESMNSRVRSIE